MKEIEFLGDSLRRIAEFPLGAKQEAGYQLHLVQIGRKPDDWKPLASIGPGVEEIRVWDADGTFRVVYTARMPDAVYVLHAFQKKAQSTPKKDLELAKMRYQSLMKGRT